MSEAAAIKATWATYKPVPTRNCLQLVLEVPLEQQADVFKKLGYPVPGSETWVGVALLRSSTDKPAAPEKGSPEKGKRRFDDFPRSQQAALMCDRADFQKWLGAISSISAAEVVREQCAVRSRAEFDGSAAEDWDRLLAKFYSDSGQMAEVRG